MKGIKPRDQPSGFNTRISLLICISSLWISCEQSDPSPPLSPNQALKSFDLADPELEIELVAAEPLVQDPVAMQFDAKGRLWVVEMLGFMQDIDGTGENDPVGRVSVLTDDNGDGRMDRSTVFLDSLVMPRALAVVEDGVLVAENIPLWLARDTDGDDVADERILIDSTYGGSGMPEHSANGLLRGMDNWYYNAKSHFRYRKTSEGWIKASTEFRGQWGIAQDDAGRLFYNYNWSQLHADLVPPGSIGRNPNHKSSSGIDHGLTLERRVFPVRSNTAINRGYVPGTLDEAGRILEFASACGPLVYRGNALPDYYNGDAFVCEPTGNLIKQNNIVEEGFMLSASGVYKNREFLASRDERFRPVSLASGPDGALYVVDMYKGIIQHGPYMTPYLREVTLERKLDKPIHMGRIWRIKRKNSKTELPDLAAKSPKEWVTELNNPNGWTRDMAQHLLVAQKDTTLLPELETLAAEGEFPGQLHAIWTLEGLHALSTDILWKAVESQHHHVVSTALRLLNQFAETDTQTRADLEQFTISHFKGAVPAVQLQMVLSGYVLDAEPLFNILNQFLVSYGSLPLGRDAVLSVLQNREMDFLKFLRQEPSWQVPRQDREIIVEQIASAVVRNGKEDDLMTLFDWLGTAMPEHKPWMSDALVAGISQATSGADTIVQLRRKPQLFQTEMHKNVLDTKEITNLEAGFSWPGKVIHSKHESRQDYEIDPEVVVRGRQQYLNLCANCHGTKGEGLNRFAPPLKGSEWVLGEDYKLAMILLHGMEGPVQVNGKTYNIPDILPSMPSFTTLQDPEIAAIATYIRNAWGNTAEPIKPGRVGAIRFRTQGKLQPWKSTALDTLNFTVK